MSCGDRRRRHRQGRHGGSRQGAERPSARRSAATFDLEHLPWSADHYLETGETLPANGYDLLRRVRRGVRRRARRSARRRQPARARHPARHALRARSLRQLPAGQAARRSPVPAQGSRPQGHQLRRVPREHRRRLRQHRRPLQGRAPTTRSRSRKRSTPTRACTASSATRSSSRKAHGQTKVCMADKSNAMQQGHALWQRVFKEVAARVSRHHRDRINTSTRWRCSWSRTRDSTR